METNKIKAFWEWFSDHYSKFGENFENKALLIELDRRIANLGNFVWELGPGFLTENMLVISPGGQVELLSETKEVISFSPFIDIWEFHYAKPPKQWEPMFDFYKKDGGRVEVNASSWQYMLLKYQDGMLGVIVKYDDLLELDSDEKLIAAEILLDGILGEEKRLLTIAEIDVVSELEERYKNKATDIKLMVEHIDKALTGTATIIETKKGRS